MLKTVLLRIVCLLLSLPVVTAVEAYTVRGKVAVADGEPLIGASIRLLAARDSARINSAIANNIGAFAIPNV